MGIAYNAKVVSDGLIYCLDSQNSRCFNRRLSELPDISTWVVGTSAPLGFSHNGDGNSRIIDTNPWGYEDIIWDVSDQDAASDADGGWNGSTFAIDNTKTYRFCTWMNRKVQGNGSYYMGTHGLSAADANLGVLYRSTAAENTNPYFSSTSWTLNNDEWYLIVGHVWPAGSGSGSVHADTGIYNTSGVKQSTPIDFVWQTTNYRTRHRSYLYYSTDTATQQQWYHPRVDICDGTEPSVDELINGYMNKMDATGKTKDTTLQEVVVGESGFEFSAANTNCSISVPLASAFNKEVGTIECWINPTAYSGGNGIFVNRDSATVNALDWLWIGTYSSGSTLYFRLGNGTACCSQDLTLTSFSTTHAPTGTWTHLACSWEDAVTSEIYINGVEANNRALTNVPNTSPATEGRIGLGHSSGQTAWNGKIDQFKIYNRVLTPAEVMQNYLGTKGRYGL